jgi:hypothetical protein
VPPTIAAVFVSAIAVYCSAATRSARTRSGDRSAGSPRKASPHAKQCLRHSAGVTSDIVMTLPNQYSWRKSRVAALCGQAHSELRLSNYGSSLRSLGRYQQLGHGQTKTPHLYHTVLHAGFLFSSASHKITKFAPSSKRKPHSIKKNFSSQLVRLSASEQSKKEKRRARRHALKRMAVPERRVIRRPALPGVREASALPPPHRPPERSCHPSASARPGSARRDATPPS